MSIELVAIDDQLQHANNVFLVLWLLLNQVNLILNRVLSKKVAVMLLGLIVKVVVDHWNTFLLSLVFSSWIPPTPFAAMAQGQKQRSDFGKARGYHISSCEMQQCKCAKAISQRSRKRDICGWVSFVIDIARHINLPVQFTCRALWEDVHAFLLALVGGRLHHHQRRGSFCNGFDMRIQKGTCWKKSRWRPEASYGSTYQEQCCCAFSRTGRRSWWHFFLWRPRFCLK